MADLGLVTAELQSIPAEWRPAFMRIFTTVLKDLRFGHPSGAVIDPCTNFGAGFLAAVTPSTPGDLFTIAHPFGRAPYMAMGVLPLDVEGAQLVPLTVERAADARRIYLSSTVGSAPITLFVEG